MYKNILLDDASDIVVALKKYEEEFINLRHFFHAHPERSKQEFQTSDTIAHLLTSWGIQVERNIANTGLVGLIKKGSSKKMIGIRADMDALPIEEATQLPYASKYQETMHACGHDGHMTMLLMAAKYLSLDATFDGQVALIFQPDEEDTAGAQRMVQEGLFEKYPVDCVFGMHVFPSEPVGTIMIKSGPQMAGTVGIKIIIEGQGCHAAHPYKGVDTVLVASHVIVGIQSIISRNISPLDTGIITIASIHGGEANNVIPQTVTLTGTLRYFDEPTRNKLEARLQEIVHFTAQAYGATANVKLTRGYIPTINHLDETKRCLKTAQQILNADYIKTDKPPSMGAEDFAFMLDKKPGAYIYIGNGDDHSGKTLHNPKFDFNDQNILIGGYFWAQLALDFLSEA